VTEDGEGEGEDRAIALAEPLAEKRASGIASTTTGWQMGRLSHSQKIVVSGGSKRCAGDCGAASGATGADAVEAEPLEATVKNPMNQRHEERWSFA